MILPTSCLPANCIKDNRITYKNPTNKKVKIRIVPAFTIQVYQKNTKVIPAPKTDVFEIQPLKPTRFRTAYLRGEIPAYIEYPMQGQRLAWKIPVEKLDYHYYLPLFLTGLSEGGYPFNYIVERGIADLVKKGKHKILPCIPDVIIPFQEALRTKVPSIIIYVNKCIQSLVKGCENVGLAFIPYYGQLLPTMNLFLSKQRYTNIDETLFPENDVYYSIETTLNILEQYGGPNAFINIKYFIPTYESCTQN